MAYVTSIQTQTNTLPILMFVHVRTVKTSAALGVIICINIPYLMLMWITLWGANLVLSHVLLMVDDSRPDSLRRACHGGRTFAGTKLNMTFIAEAICIIAIAFPAYGKIWVMIFDKLLGDVIWIREMF